MSIHVITGPMFAGKTSALIRLFDTISEDGANTCVILKPARDTRYALESIVTHCGLSRPCSRLEPAALIQLPSSVTHVFIDEVQFCEDLAACLLKLTALPCIKEVYLAGLTLDCKQSAFGDLQSIQATSVVHLTGPCARCGSSLGCYTTQDPIYRDQTRRVGTTGYAISCSACLPGTDG